MAQDATFEAILSAQAVRSRCHRIGELAEHGHANWFVINQGELEQCTKLVEQNCLAHYPDLKIPYHSRWRHFEIGDKNLWLHHTHHFTGKNIELARSAVDLIFLSVLLDAGAGEHWRYHDAVSSRVLTRSEGLAAASIDLFFNHIARFEPSSGWIMDADCLNSLAGEQLAAVFQHSSDNPLLGIDGRLSLLQGLATVLQDYGLNQGRPGRPGNLIDECLQTCNDSSGKPTVDATDVLAIVLKRFGGMWPSGYIHNGFNLGDCGYHSQLSTEDDTDGIVPFHKLSQWLTYSLLEPLQWAGMDVVNLDGLTGLPEYRNGGLFIDSGVLQPKDTSLFHTELSVQCEAVVEWRALTVYLLDQLAQQLRHSLDLSSKHLPLASVLQGGTWATGRELAARLRPDGSPPLQLKIDGTIF